VRPVLVSLVRDGLLIHSVSRRKPGTPAPWSTITNDSAEVALISRAVNNPQIITVSDWSNYTSGEYLAAEEASDLDIL
jgi:hypothetical protein